MDRQDTAAALAADKEAQTITISGPWAEERAKFEKYKAAMRQAFEGVEDEPSWFRREYQRDKRGAIAYMRGLSTPKRSFTPPVAPGRTSCGHRRAHRTPRSTHGPPSGGDDPGGGPGEPGEPALAGSGFLRRRRIRPHRSLGLIGGRS